MYLGDEHVCIYICILGRKMMLQPTLVRQILSLMKMSVHMPMQLRPPTFGVWEISNWEYVIGKFDDYTEGLKIAT